MLVWCHAVPPPTHTSLAAPETSCTSRQHVLSTASAQLPHRTTPTHLMRSQMKARNSSSCPRQYTQLSSSTISKKLKLQQEGRWAGGWAGGQAGSVEQAWLLQCGASRPANGQSTLLWSPVPLQFWPKRAQPSPPGHPHDAHAAGQDGIGGGAVLAAAGAKAGQAAATTQHVGSCMHDSKVDCSPGWFELPIRRIAAVAQAGHPERCRTCVY